MDLEHKLRDLAVSESGFVFDPYTGATFSANDTGLVILEGLRAGLDRQAVVAKLRDTFDLRGDEDVQRDLDEFLELLRKHRLVPSDFRF